MNRTTIDKINNAYASVNNATLCAPVGVERMDDGSRRLYLGSRYIADITDVSLSGVMNGKAIITGFAIHGRTYRDLAIATYFYETGYAEGLRQCDLATIPTQDVDPADNYPGEIEVMK